MTRSRAPAVLAGATAGALAALVVVDALGGHVAWGGVGIALPWIILWAVAYLAISRRRRAR